MSNNCSQHQHRAAYPWLCALFAPLAWAHPV